MLRYNEVTGFIRDETGRFYLNEYLLLQGFKNLVSVNGFKLFKYLQG